LIVVDASALVAALTMPHQESLRAWTRLAADPDQHAPHFIDLEIAAAIRNRLARGSLAQALADAAIAGLAGLPIHRYPHLPLLPRIWELRHNLTPYDAAYVALAEVLGAPLLTADAKLAGAPGLRCEVELLA
jgi:predicted nucleic acid-binding protein